MRGGSGLVGVGAASLVLVALCSCGEPSWRIPDTSRGSAAPAPEVLAIAGSEADGLRPGATAKHRTSAPLPAPPVWAAGLIGKQIHALFPAMSVCLGNTDSVRTRYVGAAAGVELSGWGWDGDHHVAPPRILLVDEHFTIQGAGESGAPRPGVPKARPEVTSVNVGWTAITPRVAGPIYAWGLLADGKTVCRLGHLEL